MMNKRSLHSINEKTLGLHNSKDFTSRGLELLAACLVFGQATTINVVGESNLLVIYTKPHLGFVSDLTEGQFIEPNNPRKYFSHYGSLLQSFLRGYSGLNVPNYRIRKNIDGKTAIMEGFAKLLQFKMNPRIIELAGKVLSIRAFENNPEIWNRKSNNYAFSQVFENLIAPSRLPTFRDVTHTFLQVFIGKEGAATHKITSRKLRGTTAVFWKNDYYGRIALDYATISQFFGKNFYKIQPALFYTYYNLEKTPQALSIDQLLNYEFTDKIDHLHKNFDDILSTKYSNGQTLTAFFHKEDGVEHGLLAAV